MRNIYYILCVLCVMVESAAAQNISRIEYFFNTDPGFGQATALTGFTSSANVANFPASINLNSVSEGVNNLYIRSKDDNGNWSITNVIPFIKVDVSTHNIVRAEYFLNTDPGFGQATTFTLPVSTNIIKQDLSLNIESAPLGINILYLRTEDSNGRWSLTNYLTFIKGTVTVTGNISSLEYYIDNDPGFGMATPVSLVPAQDISNYNFNADISFVTEDITHNLFIRSKDVNGVWSLTNVLSFKKMLGTGVNEFIDTSTEFKVFPNPATDKITLQSLSNKKMDNIELIDIRGNLIQAQNSGNSTEKQIDIGMLTKGIYFIKITSGIDVVYKKVVKD